MYPKTKAGLKQELKDLAAKIKADKKQLKAELADHTKRGFRYPYGLIRSIPLDRFAFRHKHIVYCLLRGRTMEQIEKPSTQNPRSGRTIEILLAEYKGAEHATSEAVCVSTS